MKKFYISLAMFTLVCFSIKAQDTIILKDYSIAIGKVTKISEDNVEYKSIGNLDGPIYTLKYRNVAGIKYPNGHIDVFDSNSLRSYYAIKDKKKTTNNDDVNNVQKKTVVNYDEKTVGDVNNTPMKTFNYDDDVYNTQKKTEYNSNTIQTDKQEQEKLENQKMQSNTQPKYDILYNKTIITLSKIGLPSATIISKIKTSVTSFDVSTDALIDLSSNGVNGDVINEMIKINDNANSSVVNEINSNNPNEMHKNGIYYYNPKDATNPLKKINATVVSGSKTGGFSYGGYGASGSTSTLSGLHSRFHIDTSSPEFYFYFNSDEKTNGENWFFATATSPNEFVCVWLYLAKDHRFFKTGGSSTFSASSGIPEKDKVQYNITEIKEGIYKVSFNSPLKKGEYSFMYAGVAPSMYSNNKIFDFSISVELKK